MPSIREKFLNKIRGDFHDHWPNYIFQTVIALVASVIVLSVMEMRHDVIIASIGATTFIMFAKPHSDTAEPRHVIAGQIIGITSGIAWTFIPHASYIASVAVYTAAVGTAFFVMVITDTDHPPAAGTALGVCISGLYWDVLLALGGCIIGLAILHGLLKKHLRDLI